MNNQCHCCLQRPSARDLRKPFIHLGITESYSAMFEECFAIHLIIDSDRQQGICLECVDQLRGVCHFKLQVLQCQAILRERWGWQQHVKEEMDNQCHCCLQRPSARDLRKPFTHLGITESYPVMFEECFAIHLTIDSDREQGICLECVDQLRGACHFKLQVLQCQVNLREHWGWQQYVKDELLGPGAAAGGGASDYEDSPLHDADDPMDHDEVFEELSTQESLVKQEPGTVDEPDLLVAERSVESEAAEDAASAEEGPALAERSVESEAAEDAASAEEGPALLSPVSGSAASPVCSLPDVSASARARRQLAAACAVRLERLRESRAPRAQQDTYCCDMCTGQFDTKSTLIRHIRTHYRCADCRKSFMMSSCLSRHEPNCTENKRKKRQLTETSAVTRNHGEELYSCDECGKGFRIKSNLGIHIQRTHIVKHLLNSSHSSLYQTPKRHTQMSPTTSPRANETSYKLNLQTHRKNHTKEKRFKCNYCYYKCHHNCHLQTHQRIHTGAKPFKCSYCDYKCNVKYSLQVHQRIHTGEKPFKCSYCDYKCRQKFQLQTHQRIHTGEKQTHQRKHTGEKQFQCANCDYKCWLKQSLIRHQRIHTGEKPFKCGYCDFKCGHMTNLRTHQRTHTGEKPCGYCDYKSSDKSYLRTHERTHTGEKPFECGYCDYKSSHKSYLRTHERTHTGEKPFECGYCDYKSSHKSYLRTHERTHTGEKPFKCGHCDYKCSDKSSLRCHQRIHTGEEPFKCSYCDYKCRQKSQLQTHQRIHTGGKLFKCGYCDYKCNQKSQLQTHKRIHTGDQSFNCDYCDYKCSDKSSLRAHQKSHQSEAV